MLAHALLSKVHLSSAGPFYFPIDKDIRMDEVSLTSIPATVEQAVETLMAFYSNSLPQIREMSQNDFKGSAHFGVGKFIRNTWCLWWHEGHNYESWPIDKPVLVKYFNNLGIVHSEDMSSILLACFYRGVHKRPLKVEEQVDHYKGYRRNAGFADEIPK